MNDWQYDTPPIESTVCFTGHRHLSPEERDALKGILADTVETLCSRGYKVFLCGGALGFDTLAAKTVIQVRERLPDIRLHLILPCKGQSDRWPPADRQVYRQICRQADQVLCLSDFYYTGCMLTRNRFMVDHSSLCAGYMTQARGGTWATVRYAVQKKRTVVNLAVPHALDRIGLMKENTWNCMFIFPSVFKNVNTVRLHPLQAHLKNTGRSMSMPF